MATRSSDSNDACGLAASAPVAALDRSMAGLRPAERSRTLARFASALFESAPDAMLLVDEAGVIVLANVQAEALFGYPLDELIGASIERLVPERLRAAHVRARADYAAAPRARPMAASSELQAVRRDGSEVPVEIALSPIETPDGTLVIASVRSIAARRAADRALRAAEERFRLAFDEAPIGVAMLDTAGQFLRVNHALCELLGYAPEELEARTFLAITHPDDLAADMEARAALLRGDVRIMRREKRYVHRDGHVVYAAVSVSVVRDARGEPLHCIAQIEDTTEQQHAIAALRRSEQRYHELVEHASDGILVAGPDGRYEDVNSALCRLLGYTRDELVGAPIGYLVGPEDRAAVIETVSSLRSAGGVAVGEWTMRRKDGGGVPVEVSVTVLPDGRTQAFVRDVTERRRRSEALAHLATQLDRAHGIAGLGSWEWDLKSGHVTRSPTLRALYGLAPGDDTDGAFELAQYIPESERDRVVAMIREAVRRGTSYAVEHRFVRPDGQERTFLQQGEPVVERGELVRYAGTTLDVTALRTAERERAVAHAELRAVLDQCPVAIMILRAEPGATPRPNRQARLMLGESEPPDRDAPRRQLYAPDGIRLALEQYPLARALRGEHVAGLEPTLRRPDGAETPILVNAAPITDDAGRVLAAVVAWVDTSAAKALERLRVEWNSVVAHDLRQPINSIELYTQLIARSSENPELVRDSAQKIRTQTARLTRMTHDLLDLSRLEANRLTLRPHSIELGAWVRDCVARVALEHPDQRFDVREGVGPTTLEADPDRLAQVLENLLSNAVKYGRSGAPIVVEVGRADGAAASVAVTNRGAGLTQAEIDALFQRFQRTDATKRSGPNGIGLGLHITRGLVEAHGGRMNVRSIPGESTTFGFTLPLGR